MSRMDSKQTAPELTKELFEKFHNKIESIGLSNKFLFAKPYDGDPIALFTPTEIFNNPEGIDFKKLKSMQEIYPEIIVVCMDKSDHATLDDWIQLHSKESKSIAYEQAKEVGEIASTAYVSI